MTDIENARCDTGASKPGGFEADNTPEVFNSQQAGRSARETDDDFHGVVARLSATRRVIQCRDGIQWILQNRVAQEHATTRWAGVAYCRTRSALIQLCRTSSARIDPIAWAALAALPEHFNNHPINPAPRPAAGPEFVRLVATSTAGLFRHDDATQKRKDTKC